MIEMVEAACALPTTMQGRVLEDVARNVDAETIRQPVGVCAAIVPFNFPAMVPFWFLPFAIGCGNTFVLKPSEQVPMTQQIAFEVLDSLELPPGVVNLVNGGREIVEGILDHPGIDAVSFVGSAPVARLVYERAAASGKRVQALGGAKNHMVVMPDAVIDKTVDGIIGSAFGAAGQRCMAGSVVVTVGEAHEKLIGPLRAATESLRVGDGLEEGVDVGPVVSESARDRIRAAIEKAGADGADVVVDGRADAEPAPGSFVGPTILDGVQPGSEAAEEEIFGPVALDHQRRHARRGDRARELEPVRQRHVDLHGVRRVGPALPPRGRGGHDRRQHRRRRARRLLPVLGLEGLVPRRPARARRPTRSSSTRARRPSPRAGSRAARAAGRTSSSAEFMRARGAPVGAPRAAGRARGGPCDSRPSPSRCSPCSPGSCSAGCGSRCSGAPWPRSAPTICCSAATASCATTRSSGTAASCWSRSGPSCSSTSSSATSTAGPTTATRATRSTSARRASRTSRPTAPSATWARSATSG